MQITRALLAIILLPALGNSQSASTYIQAGPDGKSWTIGNRLVEREIRYDPQVGLYTSGWRHKLTETDFMKRAQPQKRWGREFSFVADGQQFSGAGGGPEGGFELMGVGGPPPPVLRKRPTADPDARGVAVAGARSVGSPDPVGPSKGEAARPRTLLSILLHAKAKPLAVHVFYEVYEDHPVIRKWISITNHGPAPVTLTHLVFEAISAVPGPPADLQVSGFYGIQPREIFFTGRVEDAAVVERNSRTGEGLIVMNEAPGFTKRTEMAEWGEGFQAMYDTDLFPFERRLEPGETFTSAKCSVAFFLDGQGMADPHWVVPTYTSQVLLKKGSDYQPPWIYNTWEPFERGINRDIVADLIPVAGRMNLDIFTIDDGWQADYGENRVNFQAFPTGLEEVGLLAGRNNLRLGLWVPLAAVSPNTAVYKEHPEWVCKDASGRPKFTGTAAGGQAVMCLATPYKEIAAKRLNDLISRYHLKYLKVDLTTVFNAYGEAPGCYAQGHEHKTWAESLKRIYEGIEYVTERVYGEHPDVLLDLTFELWGQKHVIDYGLLAAGDLDWLSNVDDENPEAAGPRQARTLLYHRALAIPTEAMLIGNLHANTPPIEERLATAMGSGPLFLGDLRKLAPAEQDWYGKRIRWFKKLRREVSINEGFFPLGAWEQPGAASWDGFARLSRAGEGLIALFRNESGAEQVNVKLPVFPQGSFRTRSVMTGESLGEFSGEQIRQGISVRFPAQSKVQILEIRK